MRPTPLSLLAATLLIGVVLPMKPAAAGPNAQRGETLYRIHCQNCHGEDATGGGPIAEVLTVKPADLTRIRERHDGTFPRERIAAIIDGREEVPAHGSREMPIWGASLIDRGRTDPQEDEVRATLMALVDYLETIQKP